MTRIIVIAVVLIAVVGMTMVRAQGLEWTLVNWKVRHDFPNVSRITTTELHEWLNDPQRVRPLLLDVRTKPEYDVSHIHGAQRVEPGSDAKGLKLPHDKPIVTYCSVGYRSAAFARDLQNAGYKDVRNTSGSIFEWANQGYPLESHQIPADKVHPYNARWGKLLKPQLRADVPLVGAGM
jgi:rhodanese-related sulfurtransferase